MSKEGSPRGVIVWSPGHVEAFHPVTGKWTSGATISDAAGSSFGEVVLALSRRTTMVRTTRLPDTNKDQARTILQVQFESLFPLPAAECAFDFCFSDQKNTEGRLAIVACVRSSVLSQALAEAHAAGVRVAHVVPVALGAIEYARTHNSSTAAVVEPTAEGLGVDLVVDGALYLSRLGSTTADAGEMEGEAIRSYASLNLERGAVLPVAPRSPRPAETLATWTPQLNLELPETVAKRARAHVDRRRHLALLLWVAAFGFGAVLFDDFSRSQVEVNRKRTKTESSLRKLRSEEAKLTAELNSVQAANAALSKGLLPKQRFADVAVVFSNLAPNGVWLTGVTLERGKLATVRGSALTNEALAVFLKGISKQSRLRDTKLTFANNALIEKTNVVNFSLTTHVVGNFPIVEPKTKGGKK